jgi:hypothetical protein
MTGISRSLGVSPVYGRLSVVSSYILSPSKVNRVLSGKSVF